MIQPWFEEAKLGIFIHYGIYATKGTAESWDFRGSRLTRYKPYMNQINGFTASKYDPEHWAELFREAGARYAVLTTKHHDGVALFDTELSDLSVVKKSPAGRDLVKPYCEALRNNGLKVGLYFTQCDWSHPDYTAKTWKPLLYRLDRLQGEKRWKRFKVFHRAQLKELITKFSPDLLWFDGDWERPQKEWDMKGLKEWLTDLTPKTVINSRIGSYGDYDTPEQQMPTVRPDGPWEYCMTINDSWGYRPHDKHFKSPEQIIRIFSEVVSMGGNLLLDVGPKEDGTIIPEQEEVLRELGKFTRANEKAIWGTKPVNGDIFDGGKTVSADGKTVYLFQYGEPVESVPVFISTKEIEDVTDMNGEKINFTEDGDKIWVTIPESSFIHQTAVFAVSLKTTYEEAIK